MGRKVAEQPGHTEPFGVASPVKASPVQTSPLQGPDINDPDQGAYAVVDPAVGNAGTLVIPLRPTQLCRFWGSDDQQYLALRLGPWQYTFYRRQTSLARARDSVQQWQQLGHAALVTHDDGHYAVWVKDLHGTVAV